MYVCGFSVEGDIDIVLKHFRVLILQIAVMKISPKYDIIKSQFQLHQLQFITYL